MITTKPRTSQVEVIELDNPNISVNKACELMKKLTVVAISSICYLRDIFPDKAFNQRRIDGMPVKVLIGVKEIPGTYTLIDWIKSAFEAVKENYLKKIIFVIEKPNDENTLETYTFRFTYNKDAILCSLENDLNGKEIELDLICPENVKAMARRMLRALFVYTQTLEPLPNGSEMGMRLEFYDNVPDDFVAPKNFKAVDSLGIKFPECMADLIMGKIDTKFTTLSVASKSILDPNRVDEQDGKEEELSGSEDELVPPSQDESLSVFHKTLSIQSNCTPLIQQLPASTNQDKSCAEDSVESSNTTRLSEAFTKAGLEEKVVKCICGCTDNADNNIKCELCSKFQHRACYKVLEDQTILRHICIDCYETNNDSNLWAHPYILNDTDRKASALYRRALLLCSDKSRVSVTMLVNELKIKRQAALNIFNKLGADGCLSSPSGKGFLRLVKTDYLKKVLSHHFSGDNVEDMETEENNMNTMNATSRKRKASVLKDANEEDKPIQRQKRKVMGELVKVPVKY